MAWLYVAIAGFLVLGALRLIPVLINRWADSIDRKHHHFQEFYTHANAVYDNAVADVPEVVSDNLDMLAKTMMRPRFAMLVIEVLETAPGDLPPPPEKQQQAMMSLTEEQMSHFATAFLHAAMVSAESSFIFGRTIRNKIEFLMVNRPEPEAMTQRVIQTSWKSHDNHHNGDCVPA